MKISLSLDNEENKLNVNLLFFFLGVFFNVLALSAVVLFAIDTKFLIYGLGFLVISLLMLSFDVSVKLFISLIFVNIGVTRYSVSEVFVLPLLFSLLICNNKIDTEKLKNPLAPKFIFFILTIIPSLFNTISLTGSFIGLYNLLALILVVYLVSYASDDYTKLKQYVNLFLILGFSNAIVTIMQAILTGNRVFGFAGVVSCDYSSIIIIGLLISALFYAKHRAQKFSALSLVFLSLILTRTRGPLIILMLTVIIFFLYFLLNKRNIPFRSKKTFRMIFLALLACVLVIGAAEILEPDAINRISSVSSNKKDIGFEHEADFGSNSFLTRAFVWQTAITAFEAHPIIGIGAYSFPFSSQLYQKLTPFLFKNIVKGLSTHITFLSVLTETGIVGLIGFIVFICSVFGLFWASIKIANNREEYFFSVLFLFIQIYVVFSMMVADGYIFGQSAMLWGILLGLSVANNRIISNNREKEKLINAAYNPDEVITEQGV